MCGIVAIKRIDGRSAVKMVNRRYKHQKERGQEGFGFVALKGGKYVNFLKCATEKPILDSLLEQDADEVIFHHRKPSSTPNFWEGAHPIHIDLPSLKYEYYIVHNGVISNSDELKAEHDKEKIKYKTLFRQYWLSEMGNVRQCDEKWNDSESLSIELAKELEGKQEGIAKVRGTIAFVALQMEKETGIARTLFWGRNTGNPLLFVRNADFFCITSLGKGDEVKIHELNWFDYQTNEFGKKEFTVGTMVYTPSTSGYWDGRQSNYSSTPPRGETTFEDDLRGAGRPMGFSHPSPIKTLGLPEGSLEAAVEYELEEWLDAGAELVTIKSTLEKGGLSIETSDFLLTRKLDLENIIAAYNTKYHSDKLRMPV